MNDLNGAKKSAPVPAHLGTDKWFAVGDELAQQPPPSTPDTRELATISAQRSRRAELIGIGAGLLTLAVIAVVALWGHHRSATRAAPTAPAAVVVPAAPPPAAAAPTPAVAPAPPVAAAPAVAPTVVAKPPVADGSLPHSKHKKKMHPAPASRGR